MKKFKGELNEFPEEIVKKMLENQVKQGNKKDVTVFEENKTHSIKFGGFDWYESNEGFDFWNEVISEKNFDTFFNLYPKPNYPKVMMVSHYPFDSENEGRKRVVFMEKNDNYLAWVGAETIEDSENETYTTKWEYAKDIEEEVIPEYTMEELFEKLGSKFVIKK